MTRKDVVAVQLMVRTLPERIRMHPGELEVLAEIEQWCEARADLVDAGFQPLPPAVRPLALGAAGPRP